MTELSVTQTADMMNITRQAVSLAIHNKRLPAKLVKNKWMINKADILEYKKNKYCNRSFKGKPLYDKTKGEYSVNEISNILDLKRNRIYYLLRKGSIKSTRKGSAWIISQSDIDDFIRRILFDAAS
jgi:excisionase family DNA binding protein